MPVYATLARWASATHPKGYASQLQARMLMSSWEKIDATLLQAIIDLDFSDIADRRKKRRMSRRMWRRR